MKYIISLLLIFFLSVCVCANDWSVIESDHFLIRYTRSLNTAKEIQNISENFYDKITDRLGFSISRKIDIWFCESKSEFLLANNAPIQDWASGAA
ncbi:TPA: hypothetical protein ENS27_05910, partial [bacterium]|nr:hypothetical protein [bacterium]